MGAHIGPDGRPGIPADVVVAYEPALERIDQYDITHNWYSGGSLWEQRSPGRALLAHELTHAWDATRGSFLPGSTGTMNDTPEVELTAVGLLPHPLNPYKENRYRSEVNLPRRESYLDPSKGAD